MVYAPVVCGVQLKASAPCKSVSTVLVVFCTTSMLGNHARAVPLTKHSTDDSADDDKGADVDAADDDDDDGKEADAESAAAGVAGLSLMMMMTAMGCGTDIGTMAALTVEMVFLNVVFTR